MIILYLLIIIFIIWILIASAMILIKIILALYEFIQDMKNIKKRLDK